MTTRVFEMKDEYLEYKGDSTPAFKSYQILDRTIFDAPLVNVSVSGKIQGRDAAELVPLSEWKPLRIKWWKVKEAGSGNIVPDLTDPMRPVASQRAKRALEPLLGKHVDWLPLIAKEGPFYWMRPQTVLDALDYKQSDCEWTGTKDGTYQWVEYIHRYVFHEERIGDAPIFRIITPDGYISPTHTLVTQPFVDAYRAAGLVGIDFVERWPNPEPRRLPRPRPQPAPEPVPTEVLPIISVEPLPTALQKKVKALSKALSTKQPYQAIEELKDEVDEARKSKRPVTEELAQSLGLRFAWLLASELHWRLQWGRYQDAEGPAVVSLDDKYAIFPVEYVLEKLKDKRSANTLSLLFNMLKAGQLPLSPLKGTKLIS